MARLLLILLITMCCEAESLAQYNVNRLMTSGRIALHYEDYVLSIQYFNQAINQKPHLWEPWQMRAIAKYYLDDWQGAENDATQAIERNPYVTSLYDLRGITYIRRNDYDSAIKDYSKAIELEPNNKGFWSNRAACYIEKNSIDTALVELDKIISRWKNYAPAYLMKAEAYIQAKDTANAMRWIDKTLELESYNADAWKIKGNLALQQERWQMADSCLSKALHYKPKNVTCYINRALARVKIYNLRGALSDYDTALEQDPNNFLAHYNRGLLRQSVGDDNRAIEDFDYVLSLEPGNVMALFNRATLLDRTGDLRGAIRDYSIVIRQFPNFWTGLHYRASCYRRLGMNAKAEQDEFRILKAQMNKHQGIQNRWSKAKLNAMRKLSDIDPEKYNQIVVEDEMDSEHEYESIYRGKVQNRQVSEIFQPYIALTISERSMDNISSYVPFDHHVAIFMESIVGMTHNNGMVKLRIGDVGESKGKESFLVVDSLTTMIASSTTKQEKIALTLCRSVAYSSALDYQSALTDLNRILTEQPDNVMALWQRAVCGAMLSEYEKTTAPKDAELRYTSVENDFKKLLEAKKNAPMAMYCYATYCARKGDYTKAIMLFSNVIKEEPNMPYAYYNRGLVYRSIGKIKEAQTDFSKSGELGLYGAYSLLKNKKKNIK